MNELSEVEKSQNRLRNLTNRYCDLYTERARLQAEYEVVNDTLDIIKEQMTEERQVLKELNKNGN